MSAELLREAAALMRERAKAAADGTGASDWFVSGIRVRSSGGVVCESSRFEVDHIASWHPAVALAVADSLIGIAVHIESHDCEAHCEMDGCDRVHDALRVARAYLSADSG